MNVSLIVELALVGLLAATIGYAALLNRRLGKVRGDREHFVQLVSQFEEATTKAVSGMDGLKVTAAESGSSLQTAVDEARKLADELNFLVERGERVADRLEAATRGGQARPAPPGQGASAEAPSPAAANSEAEPDDPAAPARGLNDTTPVGDREARASADEGRQALLEALQRMR